MLHANICSWHRCFMSSFKIIGLLVLEMILEVLTTYGRGGHFGHVTWPFKQTFIPLFEWRFHMNFGRSNLDAYVLEWGKLLQSHLLEKNLQKMTRLTEDLGF